MAHKNRRERERERERKREREREVGRVGVGGCRVGKPTRFGICRPVTVAITASVTVHETDVFCQDRRC